MQQNVAFPAKNFKLFCGRGVPALDAFGVSMFLPKTSPVAQFWILHWIKSRNCHKNQWDPSEKVRETMSMRSTIVTITNSQLVGCTL